MRIVLDTNVIVAALRSQSGAAQSWLVAALRRRFELLASPAIFLEYEDVLKREEQLAAVGLDHQGVDRFLAGLAAVIVPVEVSFFWRPQLKDPADEMVLETAINGRADFLVTFNVRDFLLAATRFGISVAGPAALLPYLEKVS
ncbi:putative toxin-antitoxin system toxin component, PIN family [Azospirillum sp.]|uniref:putative toxin-antitoxin system toxin component, PIN family n=1 Tax=Azospirillum sp. TaxID=34012 RepID=UPI002D6AF474|nr:putative toxin-antitoxin system toxin component, PIN family [Azospirillum sp.]HYD69393.1 putative toxin-antitoxin system toxin component, PIN family [Azospirillum sp.]